MSLTHPRLHREVSVSDLLDRCFVGFFFDLHSGKTYLVINCCGVCHYLAHECSLST